MNSKAPATVSIVYMTTGEYEDRVKAVIKCFHSEKEATAYCKEMNDSLKADNLHYTSCDVAEWETRDALGKEKYLGMRIDYTGAGCVVETYPIT